MPTLTGVLICNFIAQRQRRKLGPDRQVCADLHEDVRMLLASLNVGLPACQQAEQLPGQGQVAALLSQMIDLNQII